MIKYELHKGYKELETLLPKITEFFHNNGTTIYKIRNEIKIIEVEGVKLCIKSFGQPRIINRFVYAYFRKSKAHRSYRNSKWLLNKGVSTPQPIAWIEFRNPNRFITKSYYISLYEEHDFTMEKVMNGEVPNREEVIKEFAHFVHSKLHHNGVLHHDLGPGNVLVKKAAGTYSFSVVDVNRMSFKKRLNNHQRYSNLRRIGRGPIEISMLAKYYSALQNQDPILGTIRLGYFKYRFQKLRGIRKTIFAPFKTRVLAK